MTGLNSCRATSSSRISYPSLRPDGQSSLTPSLLLSNANPLRWALRWGPPAAFYLGGKLRLVRLHSRAWLCRTNLLVLNPGGRPKGLPYKEITSTSAGWKAAPSSVWPLASHLPLKGKVFGRPQGSPLRRILRRYCWFGNSRRSCGTAPATIFANPGPSGPAGIQTSHSIFARRR